MVWFALGPHAARSESNVMQKALNKIQRKLFITILVNKLSGSPSLRVICEDENEALCPIAECLPIWFNGDIDLFLGVSSFAIAKDDNKRLFFVD